MPEQQANATEPQPPSLTNEAAPKETYRGDREDEIRRLLNYHFDLEILHKWREVQVIQEELERGRRLRSLVEKIIMNECVYGGGESIARAATAFNPAASAEGGLGAIAAGLRRAESVGPPLRRAAARQASASFSSGGGGGGGSFSGGPAAKDRVQSEPHAQYEVRPDGTIVRMRCPKCGAEQFRSMLGFLNHCRIHCRLTFSSQDERLQRCGVIVDPGEVPPDYFQKHPSQLKQEMDLALIRADVLGPSTDPAKRPVIRSGTERPSHAALADAKPSPVEMLVEGELATPTLRGSRFYIKRRIIIGNAARCLASSTGGAAAEAGEDELPAMAIEGKRPTHRWRIFVRSPRQVADPTEDVRSFIKGVRFFLHPSYRPNDVVDVTSAPFELSRPSWGEFPVRLQIHFWDSRNQPLEIVHFVRVLTVSSSKFATVAEIAHEIDLDRRTEFVRDWGGGPDGANGIRAASLPSAAETADRQSRVSDEDVLLMVVNEFPLAGKRSKRAASARYRPLPSMDEFLRLDIADQRQQEWRRASALCQHLLSAFPSFSMTTEQVIDWCREKGYTPASVATFVSALEKTDATTAERLLYCRFCGLPHLPQDKFEVLQKYCSLRPRKVHVSSRTSAQDLWSRCQMHPEGSELVKRQRQEYFSPHYYFAAGASCTPAERAAAMLFPPPPPGSSLTAKEDEPFLLDSLVETELATFSQSREYAPLAVHFLMRAMQCFLKDLISVASQEIPQSKERTDEMPVLLTALHVYRAVTTHTHFDFLSNAYMLGGSVAPGTATAAAGATSVDPESTIVPEGGGGEESLTTKDGGDDVKSYPAKT